jgi:hypothetical protein
MTPVTPFDGIYQPSSPGAATSIPRVASTVPGGATAGPMYLVNQVATLGRWVLAPNADGSSPVAFSNTTLPFPPPNGWGTVLSASATIFLEPPTLSLLHFFVSSLSLCLSVSLSLCLSVSVSLSLCLFVSMPLSVSLRLSLSCLHNLLISFQFFATRPVSNSPRMYAFLSSDPSAAVNAAPYIIIMSPRDDALASASTILVQWTSCNLGVPQANLDLFLVINGAQAGYLSVPDTGMTL